MPDPIWAREAEVKHGRVAMTAVLGLILQELAPRGVGAPRRRSLHGESPRRHRPPRHRRCRLRRAAEGSRGGVRCGGEQVPGARIIFRSNFRR
jgi:hypothetical protein